MHGVEFLQDMAIVMIVAAIVTVIFHQLRQPVVLGYILAGLIIGPHTPPLPLIQDEHTIAVLADLGVIMLMFGLGLHFSLRDLARVGSTAFIAASLEILSMLAIGYGIGRLFGWSKIDSLFLGAILSISSTTIIIKALQELRLVKERFASLIFGILIVEDILAIAMLALLSGIAMTGTLGVVDILGTLGRLTIFLMVVLIAGLLAVPRLLRYVDRFRSPEVMLITVLGLCFGVSLLAARMGYSVALGAFLIGAVIAETREKKKIETMIEPVRDMFSALFFVAIGMMIQPGLLIQHIVPIVVITVAVVVGKVVTCTIGTFVAGNGPRTSLKVGMGLAQIGEFSFIIATLGLSLGVISDFIYPIAVMVSVITTLLTPYLIRSADPIGSWLARNAPVSVVNYMTHYKEWTARSGLDGEQPMPAMLRRLVRKWVLQTGMNMALVTGVFIAAPVMATYVEGGGHILPEWTGGGRTLLWFLAMTIALPLLVVTVQRLRGASMLLVEMWATAPGRTALSPDTQPVVAHTIFVTGTVLIALWVLVLSLAVLPPWPVALVLVIVLALILSLRWKAFTQVYAQAQFAIYETLQDTGEAETPEVNRPMPSALQKAELASFPLGSASPAVGKPIRELELRQRTGASIVAIERDNISLVNPGPDEELLDGDRILLIGTGTQIEAAGKMLLAPQETA